MKFSRTNLLFLAIALVFCCSSAAQSQSHRLRRPGEAQILPTSDLPVPTALPSAGMPFSLGAEHKEVAPLSSGLVSPASAPTILTGAASGTGSNPLKSQNGVFDRPVTSMFSLQDSKNVLNAVANKKNSKIPELSVKLLSNFDIELIVDSSLSMRKRDCPNFLSRWEWCGMQTQELSRAISPFTPRGLTVTSFASEFNVYPNSNPAMLSNLFENPAFMWGTKLAEPLQDRLGNFFANRKPGSKPMLIAVITDGQPAPKYEPMMVVDTLVNATKQMKDANEVIVVFFQIGGSDEKGRRFLSELDYNLPRYGAKYDIVRTVSFEHLQEVGLGQALVQTVQDFAAQGKNKTKSKG